MQAGGDGVTNALLVLYCLLGHPLIFKTSLYRCMYRFPYGSIPALPRYMYCLMYLPPCRPPVPSRMTISCNPSLRPMGRMTRQQGDDCGGGGEGGG